MSQREEEAVLSSRWSTTVGVSLTFAVAGLAALAAQQEASEPSIAPYQIMASTRTQLRVDIGQNKRGTEALRQATIITPSGTVPATLVGTKRVCERLCGDETDPECHYEAILRPSRPVAKPIAVLAGRPAVSAIAPVSERPAQPIGSEAAWIAALPFVDNGYAYRWTRFDDGVFLTNEANRDHYAPAINLASCTQHPVDVFTRLSCLDGQVQLLYEGPRGIVLSFADYGDAAVHPLFRLRLGDKEAVLIRLGLKAQMVVALLVKEEGQWKLEARGAEYALLC